MRANEVCIATQPIKDAIEARRWSAAHAACKAGCLSERCIQLWLQRPGPYVVKKDAAQRLCDYLAIPFPVIDEPTTKPRRAARTSHDESRFFLRLLCACESETGRLIEVFKSTIYQDLHSQTGYDNAPIRDYRSDNGEDRLAAAKASLVAAASSSGLISVNEANEVFQSAIAKCERRLLKDPGRAFAWVGTSRHVAGSTAHRRLLSARVSLMARLLCSVFFHSFMSAVENHAYLYQRSGDRVSRFVGVRNHLKSKKGLLLGCARRLAKHGSVDDLRDCPIWRSISSRMQDAGLKSDQAEDLLETAARSAEGAIGECIEAECPAKFFTSLAFTAFRDSLLDQLTCQMPHTMRTTSTVPS